MQGLFEEFDRELLLGQEILSRRSREERTVDSEAEVQAEEEFVTKDST